VGAAPSAPATRQSDPLSREAILEVMRRSCDYQLDQQAKGKFDNGWIRGAFYTGVMAAYRATGDQKYLDAATHWSEQANWSPVTRKKRADDQCCGQTYLELYLLNRDPARITPTRESFDKMMDQTRSGRKEWSWCDALYMSPPVLARLGAGTREQKYYDYLGEMWADSQAFLLDPKENLFYRDATYFDKKTKNGQKVFWSRGNGWVMGGTVRVLEFLPTKHPARPAFVDLHRKMSARLLQLQQADGLWRPSLLDPEEFPSPETSGTAFFCYAFGWGINHDLLDREQYLPATQKAWAGLVSKVTPEGKLGYVQKVAGAPGPVNPDDTHEYAVGALLLAGEQMLKLNDSK
jgi:rhamnogalacturonyl hydrolase YesR